MFNIKYPQACKALLLAAGCLCASVSNAGVVVGGTRVIYDGSKREASLSVSNADKSPYLIQAWVDANGTTGDITNAPKPPFVMTPPIFRLDAGNGTDNENMMRIIRTGGNLPDDRESVFWVNVKAIPASVKDNKNRMQISVKTRIKLFYRPEGIPSTEENRFKAVSFHRLGNQLQVTNPTPYYMTFYSLKVGSTPIKTTDVMVPPKGTATYPLTNSGAQVTWQIINDYGGVNNPVTSPVQ